MNHAIELTVSLFAGVSERAQRGDISLRFDASPRTDELIERLALELPNAADLVRVSRLAVDEEFVDGDFILDGTHRDISLIPPVSGG